MSHTDKDILEELYRLEPKLKENESAILEILAKMRTIKPEIMMNEDFRETLKSEIMAQLRSQQKIASKLFSFHFSLPIISTAFACLLIGVFISELPISLFYKNPSFVPQIIEIDTPFSGDTLQYSRPAPAVNQPMALAWNATMMKAEWDRMILPVEQFPFFTYVYTGSIPEYTGSLDVYKRNVVTFSQGELSSFFEKFRVDGINFDAFDEFDVTNISLAEKRAQGYILNIDFANGNIMLSKNWDTWQAPCVDGNCPLPLPLKESDIPSDEELIKIGNEFLEKYGLSDFCMRSPQSDINWRIYYAEAKKISPSTAQVPEEISLVYPQMIDATRIYEEYGTYKWLTLSIDVRSKKVATLFGFEKQSLIKWKYSEPTDKDTIEKIIRFGWRYEMDAMSGQVQKQITLGDPTLWYVRLWGEWYDNGRGREFYVPAYVFPITREEDRKETGRQNIIVPLVKDFASFYPLNTVGNEVPPTPTPLMVQ